MAKKMKTEAQSQPAAETKKPSALDAVDYPVLGCPHCTSTNTIRLPERPERAVQEGWFQRLCRECDRKFKEFAKGDAA